MSQNTEQVQIELKVKDNASRDIKRGYDAISREAQKAARSTDAIAQKKNVMRQLATESKNVAKGGDAIARAMQDAANQISKAVRDSAKLGQNMGKASREAKKTATYLDKIKRFGGTAADFTTGMAAGGMTAAYAMAKPVAYETQLARMSNVAFSDKDAAGRIAGMKQLSSLIDTSVASGGGTKDDAAAALNSMLAAGTKMSDVEKILPSIQKASVASGASGEELAAIITKGISQGVFKAEDAQMVLDKALKAGELGEFELKDMAKWLPSLLASSAGMKDMAGFESTLANLQGVNRVAGSTDEGANAYKNLLLKLNSSDTREKFNKKYNMDISKELAKARENGEDPVQAMVRIMQERVIGSNKDYKALQEKLANTKDDGEREKVLKQMGEILQQSAIGEIFADREAMLGFLGVSSQQAYIEETRKSLQDAQGAVNTSWEVMQTTTAAKAQETMTNIESGMNGIFNTFKSAIDGGFDMINNAMRGDETAQMATAGGITAASMATAAGVTVAGGRILRGNSGTGGGSSFLKGVAKKAAPSAAVLANGYQAYQTYNDDTLTDNQKYDAYAEQAGGAAGGLIGGIAGAFGGPLLAVIGAGVGEAVGSWLGDTIGDYFFGEDEKEINHTTNINIDGQVVAQHVEKYQMQQANRN